MKKLTTAIAASSMSLEEGKCLNFPGREESFSLDCPWENKTIRKKIVLWSNKYFIEENFTGCREWIKPNRAKWDFWEQENAVKYDKIKWQNFIWPWRVGECHYQERWEVELSWLAVLQNEHHLQSHDHCPDIAIPGFPHSWEMISSCRWKTWILFSPRCSRMVCRAPSEFRENVVLNHIAFVILSYNLSQQLTEKINCRHSYIHVYDNIRK